MCCPRYWATPAQPLYFCQGENIMDKQPPQDSPLDKLINGPCTTQDTGNPVPTELRLQPPRPTTASQESIAAANKVYLKLQALKQEADEHHRLLHDQEHALQAQVADLTQEIRHYTSQRLVHRSMLQLAQDEQGKLAAHLAQHQVTDRIWTALHEDHIKGLEAAESAAADAALVQFQDRAFGEPEELPGYLIQVISQARVEHLSAARAQVAALSESIAEINQAYFAQDDAQEYSDRMYTVTKAASVKQHLSKLESLMRDDLNSVLHTYHCLKLAKANMHDIAAQRQSLSDFLQNSNAAKEPASDGADDLIQFAYDMANFYADAPLLMGLGAPRLEWHASIAQLGDSFGLRQEMLLCCHGPAKPPIPQDEGDSDSLNEWTLASDSDSASETLDAWADHLSGIVYSDSAASDDTEEGIDIDELNNQMLHLQPPASLWDPAANGLP